MRPKSHLPIRDALFLLALVGGAALISWYSGRTMAIAELFSPVLGAIQHVTGAWSGNIDRLRSWQDLDAENRTLNKRVLELEEALWAREEATLENERLHNILNFRVPPGALPLRVCRVVGRNPDNWHQRLLIDHGQDQGLAERAVVANQRGMIGRVITVGPHTASVSLLTDPGSAVSILNTRTRSAGIMQGQGDAWPILRYMEQPEKWRVGDRLITSGLGGTDPKGLMVGRIVRIKSATDMFFPELRVQTAVPLATLEEVVVLPPGLGAMPSPKPSLRPKPTPTPSGAGSPKPGGSPAHAPTPAPAPTGR